MKRSILIIGAMLGLLSSLMVMALSYLGNAFAGLPFIPFDLFDWMARHLPGALIDTNIRLMVSAINSLHLGPTASTAKLFEQIQAIGLVAIIGLVFGLVLGAVRTRRPADLIQTGLAGGIILWVAMLAIELSAPQPVMGLLAGAIWLLILLGGWGWLMARGLMRLSTVAESPSMTAPEAGEEAKVEVQPEVAPGGMRPMKPVGWMGLSFNRRNFFLVIGGSIVSFFVLILGLRNITLAASAGSSGSSQTPPEVNAQGSGTSSTAVPGQPTAASAVNNNYVKSFPYGPETTSGPAASPAPDVLAKRIAIAPGTRDEITSVDQFYRIDINTVPPHIDANNWHLTLKGQVKTPLNLMLGDIVALPRVTQAVTMQCISNPVGGDLTSSNFWTGVRFKDVLNQAGLMPTVKEIAITAADGFYEGVPLSEAMDDRTLLVYAMNGAALTPEHGFPLRIYIPGHYGMKMPKWITDMEAVDHSTAGYWEERGWTLTAVPKTTSVIDTVTVDNAAISKNGVMPLGGIAWAGSRGISKVEVQINDRPWVEAELRTPAYSPLAWVQWRYDWKTGPGSYTVTVRATDGSGASQDIQNTDPGPEGATGLNSVQINI